MKTKGTRKEQHGENKNPKETTRDKQVRIIALRNSAKMTLKEIERETLIDFRTCQSIYFRAKTISTPSNRKRSDCPVVSTKNEKERLRMFGTHDNRNRQLMWNI